MKKTILAATLAILTSASLAQAGHDGNGGFGIQCSKAVTASNGVTLPAGLHALDYWDANHAFGYTWGLGPKNLPWQQKIMIAAQRMDSLNSKVSQELKDLAQNPSKYISMSMDKVYCGNTKISGEGVTQEVDIGSTVIPASCELVPIAKNISDCGSVVNLKQRIFVNPKRFAQLDQDSKAAIVMHEYFYLTGSNNGTSEQARALVALIARADFDKVPNDELKNEFKRIDVYGSNVVINNIKFQTRTYAGYAIEKRKDGTIEYILHVQIHEKQPVNIDDKTFLLEAVSDRRNPFAYRMSSNGKLRDYYVDQDIMYTVPGTGEARLVVNLKGARISLSEDGSKIEDIYGLDIVKATHPTYSLKIDLPKEESVLYANDGSVQIIKKNRASSSNQEMKVSVGNQHYSNVSSFYLNNKGEIQLYLNDSIEIGGRIYADKKGSSIKYLNNGILIVDTDIKEDYSNTFAQNLISKNMKALKPYTEDFEKRSRYSELVRVDQNGKVQCWSFEVWKKKKFVKLAFEFNQNEQLTQVDENKVCSK